MFPNMSVVQGAGVGGGSLIYANVSVEPAAVAFEQGWPKEITHAELQPFVDTVGEMLEAQTVPDGQRTQRFDFGAITHMVPDHLTSLGRIADDRTWCTTSPYFYC